MFSTIQETIDAGTKWAAYCGYPCWHSETLDLNALGEKLGFDFRISHASLTPLLRCSKCGSKEVTIRMHITYRTGIKFDTKGKLME